MTPSPLEPFAYRCWSAAQRVVALALLTLLAPAFAAMYAAVRLTSSGGFLYSQTRPGVGGRPFRVWKVRTMRAGSDKNPALGFGVTSASPEVTRVGRLLRDLKLDELPQLWNVVRGEMRLVGPRPIAPVLHDRLCRAIPGFERRLQVPPGLTNLGQVTIYENKLADRVEADWRQRFESDRHYIAHRSIGYDAVVIALTVLYLGKKLARRTARPTADETAGPLAATHAARREGAFA